MEPFQGLSERAKGFLTTGESKKIGMWGEKTWNPRTLHGKSYEAKRDKGGDGT